MEIEINLVIFGFFGNQNLAIFGFFGNRNLAIFGNRNLAIPKNPKFRFEKTKFRSKGPLKGPQTCILIQFF